MIITSPHVPIVRLPVNEVRLPIDRSRRTPSDEAVTRMTVSLEDLGLLMPIGVTHASVLIFGGIRLAAAKQLGWTEIEARVFDSADDPEVRRLMEWEENDARRDLTLEEQLAFKRDVIDPMLASRRPARPDAAEESELGKLPDRGTPAARPAAPHPTTSRDLVQHYLGVSGRTMEKFEQLARWSEDCALPEPIRDEARLARGRANTLGKVDGEFKRVRALMDGNSKDETVEQEAKLARAFSALEKLLEDYPAELIAEKVSPGAWLGIATVLQRALEWGKAVGASRNG